MDSLVGGRGVRTVVNTFPVADAGGGAPTVSDECVTLTPIVVRPRRPPESGGATAGVGGGGPLGVASRASSGGGAKRARLDPLGQTSFSAYAVDAADAESVCYHGQLAAMPGKFDAAKADALGVPRGAVRGKLVRGEDVVLADGRRIRSGDVVAEKRAGLRFVVVDAPTLTHLEALADPESEAGRRFESVCGVAPIAGETTDRPPGSSVAVFVHLAPSAVAESAAYARWLETGAAFRAGGGDDRPRHLMVHSAATGGACVFRAAAAVSARLHAVDAGVFPEPRNAEPRVAEAQARALADAAAREAAVSETPASALTHPGCNLSRFTLVPLDAAGLDASAVPRALVARKAREDLDVVEDGGRRGDVASAARTSARDARDVPASLRALEPGDRELVFLGTGSSMPAKYRNVSGLFLDSKKHGGVLVDCGEGSFGQLCRAYGEEAAREKLSRLRCAWISHIHADHHVGLPTILVERRNAMRALGVRREDIEPLLVIGPAPLRRFLNAFSRVEPLDYVFVDCRDTTRDEWDAASTTESTAESAAESTVPASVVAVARSLGLRRLVSVPVVHCAQSFALVLESEPPRPEAEAGAPSRPGWKAVYSGDTRPCAALVEAARDATVLIHEATFEDDLVDDAVKKRHSTTSEAIRVGVDANCYRVILTHFSQRYPKAPLFDGVIGGGGDSVSATTGKASESVAERVGVAFDLMRVDFTALPRLPALMPAIRALFPDPVEDAAPMGDAAAAE